MWRHVTLTRTSAASGKNQSNAGVSRFWFVTTPGAISQQNRQKPKRNKKPKSSNWNLTESWPENNESCSSYKRSDFSLIIYIFFANFLEKLRNTGRAENWKAPRVHISQYYIDVHPQTWSCIKMRHWSVSCWDSAIYCSSGCHFSSPSMSLKWITTDSRFVFSSDCVKEVDVASGCEKLSQWNVPLTCIIFSWTPDDEKNDPPLTLLPRWTSYYPK